MTEERRVSIASLFSNYEDETYYSDPDQKPSPPHEVTAEGLIKSAPSTIYTYGGGSIDPINPSPADLDIRAIAHALSNQCRWTGHTTKFYSVAEHCVHVADMLPFHLALDGLMHDASEAFLSDLARPIKKASGLGEAYEKVESKLEDVISIAFGTKKLSDAPYVKEADEAMLWQEAKQLVPHLSEIGDQPPGGTPECECWSPEEAEHRFLQSFSDLTDWEYKRDQDPDSKPTNPKDAIGTDKLPLHLWPQTATAYGCLGLLEGMLKYGRSNFRETGVRASIYVDALYRHVGAWFEGEDEDPDSGLPHLSHALACLAILVEAITQDNMNDDRQYPTQYRDMIDSLTPFVAQTKARHVGKNPRHFTIKEEA